MAAPEPGRYIITPLQFDDDALLIGPVPLILPDVPVKVGDRLVERWLLRQEDNNTFSVFSGNGNPRDYKWIVKDNALFVSAKPEVPPGEFRFESAGNGLVVIGLFGKDALLTLDREAYPPLTFNKANGSEAQRFKLIRIDRDNN